MAILPPASCTRWVMMLWLSTSFWLTIIAAPWATAPSRFGPMPPVTISPTSPRARAA